MVRAGAICYGLVRFWDELRVDTYTYLFACG
jgi:hypothetical protein